MFHLYSLGNVGGPFPLTPKNSVSPLLLIVPITWERYQLYCGLRGENDRKSRVTSDVTRSTVWCNQSLGPPRWVVPCWNTILSFSHSVVHSNLGTQSNFLSKGERGAWSTCIVDTWDFSSVRGSWRRDTTRLPSLMRNRRKLGTGKTDVTVRQLETRQPPIPFVFPLPRCPC